MTEPKGEHVEESPEERSSESDVRELLRGALEEPADKPVDVLAGVQRKLRERSGGKFYGDAWSTAKEPPVLTYLTTSAIMLVIVIAAWLLLAPLRGKPALVPMEPAPVEVLPPPSR